jgi:hypothetical protein
MFRTLETFLVKVAENLSNKIFCLGVVRQEKPPGRQEKAARPLRNTGMQYQYQSGSHLIHLGRSHRIRLLPRRCCEVAGFHRLRRVHHVGRVYRLRRQEVSGEGESRLSDARMSV